ncbi:MAG: PxxKW family cysteine-rich protein [Thermodesulfobacteriota bacterium]
MQCSTVKTNTECPLMTAKGCSYKGGVCLPIVEACQGCKRAVEYPTGWYCSATPDPAKKWKNGPCNLATHVETTPVETKTKVNPLKASKRSQK